MVVIRRISPWDLRDEADPEPKNANLMDEERANVFEFFYASM
jgi:hypothetical protein